MDRPECPACGETLIVLELEGVEADRCPACKGFWLDAGELELVRERAAGRDRGKVPSLPATAVRGQAGSPEEATPSEDLRARGHAGVAPGSANRRCPRCQAILQPFHADSPAPLELDRCPRGDGFWFDARELEHLVGRDLIEGPALAARFLSEIARSDLEGSR